MKKSLLLGCGRDHTKRIYMGNNSEWGELVTLDMDPTCGANLCHEQGKFGDYRLPFADEEFDEIAAYDCLEHWGRQGDWSGFFDEFEEYHRLLKPNGVMGILVPVGEDAHADPGHTRFFSRTQFHFLTREWYERKNVTDYRWYLKTFWKIEYLNEEGGHHLALMLRKA